MNPFVDVLRHSLESMLLGVVVFLPKIIIALIILLVGWIVGVSFEKVISHLIRAIKVDSLLETAGVGRFLAKANIRLDIGFFFGVLVRWFVVVGFLIASLEIVGLTEVNEFLKNVVLAYIPQVIIATFILLVSAVAANVMQRIVISSTKTTGFDGGQLLGAITSWSIWVFGFIFALAQLGIAAEFMRILFTGIIAMLALAGGIAFGLGGKDAAARFIEKLRMEVSDRKRI